MNPLEHADLVARALVEDLGAAGDVTTDAVIRYDSSALGNILARAPGVIAGLDLASYVFATVDRAVRFDVRIDDGDDVGAGDVLAIVSGRARSLLIAERTALNFLGRMSGVATATAAYVAAVEGTGARITDTRKTMPGLRALDKYAVNAGGGVNHRMGLYDAVMIKDNHIAAAAGITAAVAKARERVGPDTMIIVEVDRLDQIQEVLTTSADRVLLDNMRPETIAAAVERIGAAMETEASGGVTLETVREIAETGVGYISVGWITHSAPQLDIALDFVTLPSHR